MIAHKTYSLTSDKFAGEIILGYNDKGYLVLYECRADMNDTQMDYFLGRSFPHLELVLHSLVKSSTLKVKLIPPDLSFECFYEAYGNKVDKKVSERRWANLSKADKVSALNYIPIYNAQLVRTGVAKMHPSTYLSKARWNDNK